MGNPRRRSMAKPSAKHRLGDAAQHGAFID
jgi:hypothetical protein